MEKERFDQLLKKSLSEFDDAPDPDLDAIWARVKRRSIPSRLPRAVGLIAAALMLFVLGTIFGASLDDDRSETASSSVQADVQRNGSAFIASLSRARSDNGELDPMIRAQVREVSLGVMKGAAAELLQMDAGDRVALETRNLVDQERRRIAADAGPEGPSS